MQVAVAIQTHQRFARAYIVEVDVVLVFVNPVKLSTRLAIREHDIAGHDRQGTYQIPSTSIVADVSHCVLSGKEITGGDDWTVKAVAGIV
jgi:hypothetical protein